MTSSEKGDDGGDDERRRAARLQLFGDDDDDSSSSPSDEEDEAAKKKRKNAQELLEKKLTAIREKDALIKHRRHLAMNDQYDAETDEYRPELLELVHRLPDACDQGSMFDIPGAPAPPLVFTTPQVLTVVQEIATGILRLNAPTPEDFLSSFEHLVSNLSATYSQLEDRYEAAVNGDDEDDLTPQQEEELDKLYEIASGDPLENFIVDDIGEEKKKRRRKRKRKDDDDKTGESKKKRKRK